MRSPKSRGRIPVIGVTGAIGSGKSAVAGYFAGWGAVVVSGDEIGHRVVARSPSIRKRLADKFGADILCAGAIDRTLLARRAFVNSSTVLALNRIVHPALIRELNREIARARKSAKAKAVVIDAALLVEWGVGRIDWDYLIGVSAPYGMRVRRLRARGLTLSQIRQFSRAQMPWNKKQKHCDCIVKNSASLSILRRQARLCWAKMLSSG